MYLTPVYNISGFTLGAGKVAVDNALSNLTQFLNTVRSIFYVSQQEDTNCKPKGVCNWNDIKYSRQDELTMKIVYVKVAVVTQQWSHSAFVTSVRCAERTRM